MQTRRLSGLAVVAALSIMVGLSFNATPASAQGNDQYNGGDQSRYSDPYSQHRFRGRGQRNVAWGRNSFYGNRDGQGQDRNWGNACRDSRNSQWNQGGGWNLGGYDQQGQGGRWSGRNQGRRHGYQNGNGSWGDQENRDN